MEGMLLLLAILFFVGIWVVRSLVYASIRGTKRIVNKTINKEHVQRNLEIYANYILDSMFEQYRDTEKDQVEMEELFLKALEKLQQDPTLFAANDFWDAIGADYIGISGSNFDGGEKNREEKLETFANNIVQTFMEYIEELEAEKMAYQEMEAPGFDDIDITEAMDMQESAEIMGLSQPFTVEELESKKASLLESYNVEKLVKGGCPEIVIEAATTRSRNIMTAYQVLKASIV
ncbi:hypothetical protein [Anoxynatronum sibiricum]|uniref:Uncharacterized protein n=1 Tax=Anoxynatronum sibiricum TaxID=210623 RepID=A0ABU9VTS6_9CLOT